MKTYASPYQRCKKCHQQMNGIQKNEKPARDICEACGGNTTAYDSHAPHPDSGHARRKKLSEDKE